MASIRFQKRENYHIEKMYVCDVVDMDSCESEASCAMYCMKKCNMFFTNEGDTRVRARVYWVPCGKEKAFMDIFSGQKMVYSNSKYVCSLLRMWCTKHQLIFKRKKPVGTLGIQLFQKRILCTVVCTVHTGTL